jgi:hypothetical protein
MAAMHRARVVPEREGFRFELQIRFVGKKSQTMARQESALPSISTDC